MIYHQNVLNYNIKVRGKVFNMNLQENINRIRHMMGINESLLNSIKRRTDFNEDEFYNLLKEWIMRHHTHMGKEENILRSLTALTYDLMQRANLDELEQTDESLILTQFLKDKFYDRISVYYDRLFDGTNDEDTYCFIKHSERYGGLQSRGFSECITGWHKFISKYGSWLPLVDWPNVKEELNNKPPKTQLLLAKPEEGHPFHYYFSIVKT